MPRPRTHRQDLPARVYYKHGAYRYVAANGKWSTLDKDYAKAMAKWAELIQPPLVANTMNDLFDRYALQILPNKAPRTQRDNLTELHFLRAFFGAMPPESVLPQHIADYRDRRKAKTRGNRELALLSHAESIVLIALQK